MIRDPIVDEVRAIREELAAKFNFDIRRIVEDARRRQAASQSRVVSFEKPSQLPQPTGPAVAVSDHSQLPQAGPVAER
ncbi:MAG: hypothetical protein K1X57_11700 [Gemmataceae bacterium]|nr:hypothetical protein [Gemmataceae bacterium]